MEFGGNYPPTSPITQKTVSIFPASHAHVSSLARARRCAVSPAGRAPACPHACPGWPAMRARVAWGSARPRLQPQRSTRDCDGAEGGNNDGPAEFRSYRIVDGEVTEEEVTVVDELAP